MKNIITTIIICLFYSSNTYAQNCNTNTSNCENGNGINTNPNISTIPISTTNPNCSSMLNNFDWRVQRTDLYPEDYIIYGPGTTYKEIQNPFTGPSGAHHASYVTNQGASNYQPEDGWELLKVEFGTQGNVNTSNTPNYLPNQPSNYTKPKLPYMILYNKYTGTMRFFGSLLDANEDYETLEITLKIPSKNSKFNTIVNYDQDLKATNLLSIQGETVQPLDQETKESSISIFLRFGNNENSFFWFDLPVAYDPCLCNNRAQLDIAFQFVQTAEIKLNQVLEKGIKTEKKGNNDYAKMVFGRILAAGVSGATAIATSGAVVNVKAFIDLVDIVKEHPSRNQTEKDNLTTLKNYLTCSEKLFSVIKGNYKDASSTINNTSLTLSKDEAKKLEAGLKILEGSSTFLTSLVNGCNNKDNAATASTKALKFEGTFTRTPTIVGTDIFLALPGSNWGNTNLLKKDYVSGTLVPAYPTYNERLGTFALLETPKLDFNKQIDTCSKISDVYNQNNSQRIDAIIKEKYSFKLGEDIKYSFNPKMNINYNKTTIDARIIVSNDYEVPFYFLFNKTKKDDLASSGRSCVTNDNFFNDNNLNFIQSNDGLKSFRETPFVPLDYLKSLAIKFEVNKNWNNTFISKDFNGNFNIDHYNFTKDVTWSTIFNEFNLRNNFQIQFRIIGESNNLGSDGTPNKVYQLFTFPLNINNVTVDPNIGNNVNIIAETKDFNTDISFSSNNDLVFEGTVFISAKMSTTNGAKVKIYSLKGFELEPGAEISPDIELIIGLPLDKVPQPAQTYTQVSSFCSNTNKYKAQTFSAAAIQNELEENEQRIIRQAKTKIENQKLKVKLFPNPSSGTFNINIFNSENSPFEVSLFDLTGKNILSNQYDGKITNCQIETNGLANGVYFVTIKCGDKERTEKLIIQSNH